MKLVSEGVCELAHGVKYFSSLWVSLKSLESATLVQVSSVADEAVGVQRSEVGGLREPR